MSEKNRHLIGRTAYTEYGEGKIIDIDSDGDALVVHDNGYCEAYPLHVLAIIDPTPSEPAKPQQVELLPGVQRLLDESKKLDELTDRVQEMIYHTRWVAAFGKNGKLATDREIAEWAVAVFASSELYKGNI